MRTVILPYLTGVMGILQSPLQLCLSPSIRERLYKRTARMWRRMNPLL